MSRTAPCWRQPAECAQILAALAVLAFAAGCGTRSKWDRVALRGSVTLDGAPAAGCSVMLLPEEGNPGPAVTAAVSGGEYAFGRADGPVAGPHEARLLLPPEKSLAGGARREAGIPTLQVDVPRRSPYRLDMAFVTP